MEKIYLNLTFLQMKLWASLLLEQNTALLQTAVLTRVFLTIAETTGGELWSG